LTGNNPIARKASLERAKPFMFAKADAAELKSVFIYNQVQ
jgi:hypothetical protein